MGFRLGQWRQRVSRDEVYTKWAEWLLNFISLPAQFSRRIFAFVILAVKRFHQVISWGDFFFTIIVREHSLNTTGTRKKVILFWEKSPSYFILLNILNKKSSKCFYNILTFKTSPESNSNRRDTIAKIVERDKSLLIRDGRNSFYAALILLQSCKFFISLNYHL